MKALILAILFIMVSGHAYGMEFSRIEISFNSNPDVGVWGMKCGNFICALNPMTEDAVDVIDSLDQSRKYTCDAKIRKSRAYSNIAVQSLYDISNCR